MLRFFTLLWFIASARITATSLFIMGRSITLTSSSVLLSISSVAIALALVTSILRKEVAKCVSLLVVIAAIRRL